MNTERYRIRSLGHVSRSLLIFYRRPGIKKWSQSRIQAHKTRRKTASSERLLGALRCVSKFLRTITVRRSRPSSRSRAVWQLQRGTEIPSPRYPRSWIRFFFSGETFEVRWNTRRDIAQDYFLCKSEVCFPVSRWPEPITKEHLSRVRSLTALFHCLIRKIHTLYIARVVTLLCREIGIFASVPEKSRKKLIEKMRNCYSRWNMTRYACGNFVWFMKRVKSRTTNLYFEILLLLFVTLKLLRELIIMRWLT